MRVFALVIKTYGKAIIIKTVMQLQKLINNSVKRGNTVLEVCVCINIYMYMYIRVYIYIHCVYIYIYKHVYMYTYSHIFVYIYLYIKYTHIYM